MELALAGRVRSVCYIENDPYAVAILRSRIRAGDLPDAPIWDDVRTFDGRPWRGCVDIITGGFPCQDVSVAGRGDGLEGERSILFFEIVRLAEESESPFLFLETAPGIRTRGLSRIGRELADLGYDARWYSLSAAEAGATQERNRWWCLAYSHCYGGRQSRRLWREIRRRAGDGGDAMGHGQSQRWGKGQPGDVIQKGEPGVAGASGAVGDAEHTGFSLDYLRAGAAEGATTERTGRRIPNPPGRPDPKYHTPEQIRAIYRAWSEYLSAYPGLEPVVRGGADGPAHRVDRIRCLGNGVFPDAASEAFAAGLLEGAPEGEGD